MSVLGREEPRIFTPPLRELTPETTLGYDVIEFSEVILHMTLLPWQRWLFIHALEIVGDLGGEWHFRYRTVVVEIARQQGKTTMGDVLALFFLYVLQVALVLGTAQDLEQAEDTWEACVELAQENAQLAAEVKHVWFTNGAKRLQLTGNREYRVKASTGKAGRGKSGDLILMDELREQRTWDAWGAITKTTIARPNSLVFCMSNAGDGDSVVLRHLRLQAHRLLGDPDGIVAEAGGMEEPLPDDADELADSALGWFEWSCPPGCQPTMDNLAYACPSLGYGFVTERALAAARSTDPHDVFLTECMCQWVTTSVKSVFPEGSWEAGRDDSSEVAPDSRLWWGCDVAADRSHAAIAVCGMRADRRLHIELVAYRTGTKWLVDSFQKLSHGGTRRIDVALQDRGTPVSGLSDVIGAIDGVVVHGVHGAAVSAYAGRLWDAVASALPDSASDVPPVAHITQPALDLAASIAITRATGDGAWMFDRAKSDEDISPLIAASMAYGLATDVPEEEPAVSAYEDEDLLVL